MKPTKPKTADKAERKMSRLRKGKKCKLCDGNGCGECFNGIVIKPMRKTALRKISSKQKKTIATYSKLRRDFLMIHSKCFVCESSATDIHHKSGRGAETNNTETWISVCRKCHDKIHANPKWARQNGYLE